MRASDNANIHKERTFSPRLFSRRFVLDVTCEVCGVVSRAPFTMGLHAKTKMKDARMRLACGHVNVVSFVHPSTYEGLSGASKGQEEPDTQQPSGNTLPPGNDAGSTL